MAYFAKIAVEYATFVVEKKEECYIGFHRKRAQSWKLSRNISGTGLAFHAEDIIHDVVVNMIADEKQRTKFEGLTEQEAKAYFASCLRHRLIDVVRREKRRRAYLEMQKRYEKRLETASSSAETIVVEQLDFENNLTGTFALLSTEEQELLRQVFVQKLPYREIAKRSRLRESAIAMRVMRLRRKILKICLERGILCEKPEENLSWT